MRLLPGGRTGAVGMLVMKDNKERRTVTTDITGDPETSGVFYTPKGTKVTRCTRYMPVNTVRFSGLESFTGRGTVSLYVMKVSSPLMNNLMSILRRTKVHAFKPGGGTTVLRKSGTFSGSLVGGCGVPATTCRGFASPGTTITCLRATGFPVILGTSKLTLKGNILVYGSLRRTGTNIGRVVLSGGFNATKGRVIVRRFVANHRISMLSFISKGAVGAVADTRSRGHTKSKSAKLGANNVKAFSPDPFCAGRMRRFYRGCICRTAMSTVTTRKHPFGKIVFFKLVLARSKPGILRCGTHFKSPRTRIMLPHVGGSVLRIVRTYVSKALSRISLRFRSGTTIYIMLTSRKCPMDCRGNFPVAKLRRFGGRRKCCYFRTKAGFSKSRVIAGNKHILNIATGKGSLGRTHTGTCTTAR